MAAALCVAVLTLCGATLPTDLNTERDRLGDLPTSLRESIFLRLTGAASFASLYGSCRGLKHDTAGAMNVRRLLQAPHTVTDLDLPARIDEWAASIISQDPLVRVLHSQILTPQAALGLYDRLLNSSLNETEIARLLNILIRNVDRDVFVGVVSGFGMPTEKAHEVTFLLTDLNLGDRPVGVPQVVLDQIQALLDTQLRLAPHPEDPKIEAVRQRYPPPFDAVFPRNHVVASGLLDVVHDQLEAAVTADDEVLVLREALRDPQVLQALLRHGIRFDFQYLWCIDLSMDSFMDVYALLAPVSPEYPSRDYRCFIALYESCVLAKRWA